MNKLDFLKKLESELDVLDKEERKEILAFYEERFYNGTIYEKKTELEVISELESPEVIARNVLEEYGVSPKFVKSKEERYTNISTTNVAFLAIFDVLIVSWLLPTLYGAVVGIFGSLFSYIGVLGLLFGDRTFMDGMVFVFATGVYVLLFLFGLLVLDLSIYATKKILIYHLNVFKYKNREKIIKSLHKFSVDEWFKKRKVLRTLKNLTFIITIVLMAYSGYQLFASENNVFEVYGNQPQVTDVYTEDLAQDVLDGVAWNIVTDFDSMEIDIIPVFGDDVVVTHTYNELNEFEIDIDTTTNTITISNNIDSYISFFDINDLFSLFGNNDVITIEVPANLLLGDLDISTLNGEVELKDISTKSVTVDVTNGRITLDGLIITGNVDLSTTNGDVIVKNITGKYNLDVSNTNGTIIVRDVEFLNYDLSTTNGGFNLDNLNILDKDGLSIEVSTTNGVINMDEVYVSDIELNTTNGDINFYNNDTTFLPDSFVKHTTNGDVNTNVR